MIALCALAALPAVAPAGLSGIGLNEPGVQLFAYWASSGADSAKDVTVSLPPGYVIYNIDTTGVCTNAQALSNSCPASSAARTADGPDGLSPSVLRWQAPTGSVLPLSCDGYWSPSAVPYAAAPSGGELAHWVIPLTSMVYDLCAIDGTIGETLPWTAKLVQVSEVLRTTPTVGVNLIVTGIPNDGGALSLSSLFLYLFDGVSASQCGPLSGNLTFDTWQSSTPSSTDFSAQLCTVGSTAPPFGFAPTMAVSAEPDSGDSGVASAVTLGVSVPPNTTGYPANSYVQSGAITFPSTFAANKPALSAANPSGCSLTAVTSCRVIGTITGHTPMTAVAPSGNVYMVTNGTTTASLVAVLGAPFNGLQLSGSATALSSGQLQVAFAGLPDLPFSSLALVLNGGTGALLAQTANSGCSAIATSSLTAQDAATASPASFVALSGTVGACSLPGTPAAVTAISPCWGRSRSRFALSR